MSYHEWLRHSWYDKFTCAPAKASPSRKTTFRFFISWLKICGTSYHWVLCVKTPCIFSLINISKVFFLDLGQAASADRTVPNNYILQIHGRTPLTTYATQVSLKASSLNTNDCFILVQAQRYSIWLGKGSTEYEKELAKRIGNELDNHNSVVIDEG